MVTVILFDHIFDRFKMLFFVKFDSVKSKSVSEDDKGVRSFGPLLSQKLKIAFHQFLSIGLLDE